MRPARRQRSAARSIGCWRCCWRRATAYSTARSSPSFCAGATPIPSTAASMCASAGCGRFSVTILALRRSSRPSTARAMSSASASKASERPRRLWLWPQSLFGRLIAASVAAVLIAQLVALALIAQERERFVMQGSVREWSRRIAETTTLLAPLSAGERAAALAQMSAPRGPHDPRGDSPHGMPHGMPHGPMRGSPAQVRPFLRLPLLGDFEQALREQLRASLGPVYGVTVERTHEPAAHQGSALRYDVTVRFPTGDAALFRIVRMPGGAPLPRNLLINLTLLLVILVLALYVTARNITRPLSALAHAADRVGRDVRPERLPERGARELRDAARAFNTMQDRLRRYLDSRSRVLAAISHDLKTPLTRLRLQVETLDNPALQERIGRQLDEMEA